MTSDRKLRVFWRGPFFTNSSLAVVNRRLVDALIARGNIEISIATDPLPAAVLPPPFRRVAKHTGFGADEADVVVLHEWPPRFSAPATSRYVHIQPWEYGSMPTAWFEALHDDCDDIWVHSIYNRDAYIEAGMDPDRIAVVPHGVDVQMFNPDGPKMAVDDERFRFLFVGATIPRKGIDVLVNAYTAAFRPGDHVALMIKDADSNAYRNQTRTQELRELTARRDLPRIEYVQQTVPDEGMAQMYRGSHCFVLPYRGEGFGIPVIEAMACGLPPIVTTGGATDDVVDDGVGWRIPSTRTAVDPAVVPFPTMTPPWTLEPDTDALASLMRNAYERRDDVRARGQRAAQRIRSEWTWDRAAETVELRLDCVAGRDPVRAVRRHLRYSDASSYMERIFGSTELDGVVLEVFRRLGTIGPYYVELTGDRFTVAPALVKGVSWPGISTRHLSGEALPDELDFLSLDSDNAAGAFEPLRRYQPRVVACARTTAFDDGYVCIARSKVGDGLFVRNDLVARVGFTAEVTAAT